MMTHLPVLQVLVPMVAAPLCVLVRPRAAAWALFLLAAASATGCAVLLANQVADGEPVHYRLGGWQAPVGIEYVIDGANAPVLLLVSGLALVVAVYGRRSLASEIEAHRLPLVYACACLTLTGLLGITATGDAFNAFVFLEISSLSTYALIAMGRHRRALLAAFQYLTLGTIGATFLLLGIGLAYAVTGTLNMADLAQRLPDLYGNRALSAAVVFVFVGLAIKMALFPLHAWLPNAYAQAPSAVATFLSGTSTKVAIYAFVRFSFTVFGATLVFGRMPVDHIGLALASLAMVVGAAVACFQSDLRYLLAWSTVGQLGYIVAGLSLATQDGLAAAYLHLINHAVIKSALFAAAGILLLQLGSVRLSELAGLGRRSPWVFAAIVLAGIGLIGLPPSAGFVSKWALVTALIAQDQWLVLAAVLASSLLALVYVGRVVEVGWFRQPPGPAEPGAHPAAPDRRPPATMLLATWLLVLLSLYFGIDPSWPGELADGAAAALLGSAR